MKGNLSTPINKTAALVTSRSKHNYRFGSKQGNSDSDLPIPYYESFYDFLSDMPSRKGKPLTFKQRESRFKNFAKRDVTGKRRGRLVALGVLLSTKSLFDKRGFHVEGPRWVCRCDCGKYTVRSQKALRRDHFDACCECQILEKRKRGF